METQGFTVQDVTSRAAKLFKGILTYHVPGSSMPWRAEVVDLDHGTGQYTRIGPRGIIGRGDRPDEAIKALGVDW